VQNQIRIKQKSTGDCSLIFDKKLKKNLVPYQSPLPSMSASTSAFQSAIQFAQTTQVARTPMGALAAYADYRKSMLQAEQQANGGELNDPILYEPITTEDASHKKAITVAKFGQNGTIVGMSFIRADALIEWFKMRNTHPLTNQPLGINPLKKRAEYAARLQELDAVDLNGDRIKELFPIFLKESATFQEKYPVLHAWMQCHLKMGDTGINMTFAGTAAEQRLAAMAYLADKPVGTGVFRLSSIESTKLVECFAISYVMVEQKTATTADGTVVVEAAKIRHIAISHVMGYGYTIIGAQSGQKLPAFEDGVSNGVSLPNHDEVWASLLDILTWFHTNAANFDLSKMVLRA
jgi:hypothetical protein